MKKLITWIAGAFEDQAGSASSKRFVLYICMFFLWMVVNGSLEGKTIDQGVLLLLGAIILFSIGAITSEFLSRFFQDKSKILNTTTTTTTEETVKKENNV